MSAKPPTGEQPEPPLTIKIGNTEMFAVPASASEVRAASLLPLTPSEDARQVLGHLDVARRPVEGELQEYLPNECVDWVISCEFCGAKVGPQAISLAFDRDWRERFGAFTGYGKDAATGRWTFLVCGNGPKQITAVKLAWQFAESDQPGSRDLFDARLNGVRAKLPAFGQCDIEASSDPCDAAIRSEQLRGLKRQFGLYASLRLISTNKPFDGKQVWDVLQCLGLKWAIWTVFIGRIGAAKETRPSLASKHRPRLATFFRSRWLPEK